jgi:hypothetical protein
MSDTQKKDPRLERKYFLLNNLLSKGYIELGVTISPFIELIEVPDKLDPIPIEILELASLFNYSIQYYIPQ